MRLSDWIQAFVEDRNRPSHAQGFDFRELLPAMTMVSSAPSPLTGMYRQKRCPPILV